MIRGDSDLGFYVGLGKSRPQWGCNLHTPRDPETAHLPNSCAPTNLASLFQAQGAMSVTYVCRLQDGKSRSNMLRRGVQVFVVPAERAGPNESNCGYRRP